jgi:phosphatidylinositol alpha-1,6-mannosyltransferase
MKERKGHHVALEAVALALASVPELRWVVIAADERTSAYQEALAARAASLGVADRLRFLGSVSQDDLAAWYQRADVFLLLPVTAGDRIEGLGLVYLEAAAAGTPSIGSRDTGAAEAIVDRETGLLVPQRDSAAAAAALVQLLTDEGARRRMGEAARRRAQDLSWSRLAERLADAYRRLSQGARWSPEVGA